MSLKLWYLQQCDLFRRLTPEQAERLECRATLMRFPRGTLIYSPYEPSRTVMVLATGRVKIKDLTLDGKETILAFIEEGEIFGEMALFEGQPRGEFAETIVDSQVLVLPRAELLWLLGQRPDVWLAITKLIGLRRHRIQRRLCHVLFLSGRERLLHVLIELVEHYGQRQGRTSQVCLPLSHQDLAGLIGLTREMVTRLLGQLQAEGLVRLERRRIIIRDCQQLASLCTQSIRCPCSTTADLQLDGKSLDCEPVC
jgi:CRP-like cAMP-binding protein